MTTKQRNPFTQDGKDGSIRMDIAGQTARVYIYAPIGDWWGETDAETFAARLEALAVDTIELHVNSPGGEVWDGMAIMNTLRQHKATVVAYVDGLAASAASFIVAGGADRVVMNLGSEMMIHDASTITRGNAAELWTLAERLDGVSDNIATVYAAKAGGEASAWRDLMKAETWFSATEAVAVGLADEATASPPTEKDSTANRWDLSMYQHAGRADAPAPPAAAQQRPNTSRSEGSTTPGMAGAAASLQAPEDHPADTPAITDKKGSKMALTLTDEQSDKVRALLGLNNPTATSDEVVSAIGEALNERADEPQARGSQIPEGTVLIDETVLATLRADGQAGREALQNQRTTAQEAALDSALASGRIAPASREGWANAFAKDPAGTQALLDTLAPGTVPVDERGHADADASAVTADDATYNAVYGSKEKN